VVEFVLKNTLDNFHIEVLVAKITQKNVKIIQKIVGTCERVLGNLCP
jgi:hypothetical protein